MSYYPDEEDPLVIKQQPAPTGEVIERANLQAAPAAAPTPDHQVDAFATGATPAPVQEQQVNPAQAPTTQEVAQNWDAYAPVQVQEPIRAHRRAGDNQDEARRMAIEQERAQRDQAAAQKQEDDRASKVLRGLKASGVEIDTDPITGEQRPKTDEQGRVLYKPKTVEPFVQNPDGSVVARKTDRYGKEQTVPLTPRIDPATGEKYVTGEDGVSRHSLGVDENWLARRDMHEAGQMAGAANAQVSAIAKQKKELKKREEDLVGEIALLQSTEKPTDQQRIKLEQAKSDIAKVRGQLEPLEAQHLQAQEQAKPLNDAYLGTRQKVAAIAQADYVKRNPESALATPPPAAVAADPKVAAPEVPDSARNKVDTSWDITRGAKVAFKQIVPLAEGTLALLGATAEKVTGGKIGTGLKEWGLQGYKDGMEKTDALAHENDDVTVAWAKAKQGDIGALVDWAKYGAGYTIGQFGESAAMMALGGLIGGATTGAATGPAAPVGAVAGAVGGGAAGLIAKQAVKTGIKGLIEGLVARTAAKAVEEQALKTGVKLTEKEIVEMASTAAARKAAAASIAQGTTAAANELMMEAGSIFPEAVQKAHEEGRELTGTDLAKVWATSIGAAGMGAITNKLGLDTLLGHKGGGIIKQASKLATAEGLEEFGQTVLERLGANQSVTDKEAQGDYLNSTLMGMLGGGLTGAAGGALHREGKTAKPAVDPEQFTKDWNEKGKDLPGFVPITPEHAPAAFAATSILADPKFRETIQEHHDEELKVVAMEQEAEESQDPAQIEGAKAARSELETKAADISDEVKTRTDLLHSAVAEAIQAPGGDKVVLRAALKAAAGHELTPPEKSALLSNKLATKAGKDVTLLPDAGSLIAPKSAAVGKVLDFATSSQTTTTPQTANVPSQQPASSQGGSVPATNQSATPGNGQAQGQSQGQTATNAPAQGTAGSNAQGNAAAGNGVLNPTPPVSTGTGNDTATIEKNIKDARMMGGDDAGAIKFLRANAEAARKQGKPEVAKNYEAAATQLESQSGKAPAASTGASSTTPTPAGPSVSTPAVASTPAGSGSAASAHPPTPSSTPPVTPPSGGATPAAAAPKPESPAPAGASTPAGGHTATGGETSTPKTGTAEGTTENSEKGGASPGQESAPRSSTQLNVTGEDATKVLAFGRKIDPADLYHGENGSDSYGPEYGLEDKPHITALYGLTDADPEPVRKLLEEFGKVTATLGEVSLFENADKPYDVVKVDIHGEDLKRLNERLRTLPHSSDFPDYHPHLTIAYVKKGTGQKYVGKKSFTGRKITFDTLHFSDTERNHTPIDLRKAGEKTVGESAKKWSDPEFRESHLRAKKLINEALDKGRVRATLKALGVTPKVSESPDARSFEAGANQMGTSGKIAYTFHINEERIAEKTNGMSDADASAYIQSAIEEEIIHLGQYEAVKKQWMEANRKGPDGKEEFFYKALHREYDAVRATMNTEEIAAAREAYGESIDGWKLGAEFVRQLIQTGKVGKPTEATIRAKPIIERLLAVLKNLLDNVAARSPALQKAFEATERTLADLEGATKPTHKFAIGDTVKLEFNSRRTEIGTVTAHNNDGAFTEVRGEGGKVYNRLTSTLEAATFDDILAAKKAQLAEQEKNRAVDGRLEQQIRDMEAEKRKAQKDAKPKPSKGPKAAPQQPREETAPNGQPPAGNEAPGEKPAGPVRPKIELSEEANKALDEGFEGLFAPEPRDKVREAWQNLSVRTGYPAVSIGRLAADLRMPIGQVQEILRNEWKKGNVVFSQGDWSLSDAETRSGAMEVAGDRYLQVRFLPETGLGAAEPVGRATPENPAVQVGNARISRPGVITLGAAEPIVAHHGTPHKVDRFSLDKVGTGEGAQVYGWGLYFAQAEAVAEEYRKNLSNPTGDPIVDGKRFRGEGMDVAEYAGIKMLAKHDGDASAAERAVLDQAQQSSIESTNPAVTKRLQAIREYAGRVRSEDAVGNIYTVELDANDEDLLDWDKPLNEQSPQVRAALNKLPKTGIIGEMLAPMEGKATTGRALYARLGIDLKEQVSHPDLGPEAVSASIGDKGASKLLASLGIPGIRFLDQGSRSPGLDKYRVQWDKSGEIAEVIEKATGKSMGTFDTFKEADQWVADHADALTHNYVLFDDSKIKITHENGQPVEPETALGAAEPRPGETRQLAAPEPIEQKELPEDKTDAFLKIARALVKQGVDTPEALAQVLEQKFQGKARPYSEALWDAFGMVKKSLRGTHDWSAIYSEIDQPNNQDESNSDETPASDSGKTSGGATSDEGGTAGSDDVETQPDGAGSGRNTEDGSAPNGGTAGTAGTAPGSGGVNGRPGVAGGEGDTTHGPTDVGGVPEQGGAGTDSDHAGDGGGVAGGEHSRPRKRRPKQLPPN
jgi:hypothetical protein